MDPHSKSSAATIVSEEGEHSSTDAVRGRARFPNTFQIYFTKTNISTTIFHLGEEQSQPLFVAALHVGWQGKSDLTLYDGPDVNFPVLATAQNEHLVGMNSTIKILSPQSASAISERLRVKYHLTGESHSFAVTTGVGETAFPEKFEWRQSRSKEVVDDDILSRGWKLVQISGDTPVRPAGSSHAPEGTVTSDGKEVVAVLTDFARLSSKVAQFRFLGPGATGEFGDVWAIMAVVTALRIWQMRWFLAAA